MTEHTFRASRCTLAPAATGVVAFVVASLICTGIAPAAATGSGKSSAAKSSGGGGNAAAAAKKASAVLTEVDTALHARVGTLGVLLCPVYQRSLTPDVAPQLARRDATLEEWAAADPSMKAKWRFFMASNKAQMAFFGDATAAAALEKQATAADKSDAAVAKLAQSLLAWWNAFEDADAQKKIFDDLQSAAKADPASDDVAAAIKMAIDANPATVDLASKSWDLLAGVKSNTAKVLSQMPNKVGKPLAINGSQVNGKAFNSAQWKGEVVMVDFWATWCPPCMAELPHVAQLYAQNHEKGFEIVGVSSDNDRAEFQGWLKGHTEVPWPQLFAGGNEWHPLTKKFGIHGIPTVYLIDRNGILRSTHADRLNDFVAFLLEEPADAPADRPLTPPFKMQGLAGGWKAMQDAQKAHQQPKTPSPASQPPAIETPKKSADPLPF